MVRCFALVLITVLALLASSQGALADDGRAVYVTEIDANIDDVWGAFTTKQGLQSWMAPLADVEVAVGGKIRANYNPTGTLGDETTIENTILAFDPKRMLALKATRYPKDFPFTHAAASSWSVFYFSSVSPLRTRIEVVGLGYTEDEQSQRMRSFFASANKMSLNKLAEVLAKPAVD